MLDGGGGGGLGGGRGRRSYLVGIRFVGFVAEICG